MRTITFEVSVRTRYIGSEVIEEVSIQVDDDATDTEIEEEKEEYAREWYQDKIEWGPGETISDEKTEYDGPRDGEAWSGGFADNH